MQLLYESDASDSGEEDGNNDPNAPDRVTVEDSSDIELTSKGVDSTVVYHLMDDDETLLDWVRQTAETTYHPVGTCKMGSDAMAVVDDRLRVHGIEGLRVADASVMPTLTSGNTNAPSIMIGEKCSRMMLADIP